MKTTKDCIVQSLSCVGPFATPMDCSMQDSLPFTISLSQTHVHWVNYAIQSSHYLLPSCTPALNLSQHQGLSNELFLHVKWPKFWGFTFVISPSNDIQGWFPCCPRDSQEFSPAPQSESINFSRLGLLYGPTLTSIHDYWKTTALTVWTFVRKVMSLLFNTMSTFVIDILPRSKHLIMS